MVREITATCHSRCARTVAGAACLAVAALAQAASVPIGGSAWKTNPSVPDTPKYTIGLPAYFSGANTVASEIDMLSGALAGMVRSVVYRNPATGFLTFEYTFAAGRDNPSAIARATLGGDWAPFDVTDAGADASGLAGEGDPAPEWTDGDPLYLARDAITAGAIIQWRSADLGAALGPNQMSSRIWFETNASNWERSPLAVIDTSVTGLGFALTPTLVPLPPAAAGAVPGVLLLGARRRRRA